MATAPPDPARCNKAIKLLTQFERLAKKYRVKLSVVCGPTRGFAGTARCWNHQIKPSPTEAEERVSGGVCWNDARCHSEKMQEEKGRRLVMSWFPQLRRYEPMKLLSLFMGYDGSAIPEDEKEVWLQEAAIQIAKTGAWGVNWLLTFARYADEARLRAILLAMSFVKDLSSHQRSTICEFAQALLNDQRPMIIAEAVDTLCHLRCRGVEEAVGELLNHPSPYVVGSACAFSPVVPQTKQCHCWKRHWSLKIQSCDKMRSMNSMTCSTCRRFTQSEDSSKTRIKACVKRLKPLWRTLRNGSL